jgi:hypothetical protein
MRCPYLSSASKKECVRMLEEQVDGEVSEFDLKHFCDGNPVYCYYFRSPVLQAAEHLLEADTSIDVLPKAIPVPTGGVREVSFKMEKDPLRK